MVLELAPATFELSRLVRLAYLYSRYPIVSQTFCDTEMLALERMGVELEIYSIYPPPTSFRHGHAARLKAPIHYAPPVSILKQEEVLAKSQGRWPSALIADHDKRYGLEYKAALRARNALYFADLFKARGITHFHVHFANRAAHTAIFLKAISGIPFSLSTHGQDFMVDLGNHDLLREICREAAFVANETEFSKGLVANLCPDSAGKMFRVFNGMDLTNFPAPKAVTESVVPRIVSIGRLIEFKGFHHLIAACAMLRDRGLTFECEIIGEGPWRAALEDQIIQQRVGDRVRLLGALPQEEVFGKLRACDIFTLPCIVDHNGASDVFPTVILEAMASAKPVVSTRLAGVPEQIDSGRTGLLVDPGDERALADALGRLLQSPELRREYGEAARLRLESEFGIEKTVQPLKERFEQIVHPKPAPASVAARLACLAWEWPPNERGATELKHLSQAHPQIRTFALHVAASRVSATNQESLPYVDFLPDGMVVEGEWQQERELARQVETWRSLLGQALSSELFLQHARYAIFIRRWIVQHGIRHVHALSARELLTGWILRRLCGVTLSATIDEQTEFTQSVFSKLAGDCVGVRVTQSAPDWAMQCDQSAGVPIMVRTAKNKRGQALEPEWLGKLSEWSNGIPA